MSEEAILITQCLQTDFVQPLGRYNPLPNHLHIGYEEALRLMGENPAEGPVARTMKWAYSQPADMLKIIHIRDWHKTLMMPLNWSIFANLGSIVLQVARVPNLPFRKRIQTAPCILSILRA